MTDKHENPYHQELRDPVTVAIKRYKARIEKLEAALKPFADMAFEYDGEMCEHHPHNLEDGAFIKARKALEGKDDQ